MHLKNRHQEWPKTVKKGPSWTKMMKKRLKVALLVPAVAVVVPAVLKMKKKRIGKEIC